jgi:hypothetical protein
MKTEFYIFYVSIIISFNIHDCHECNFSSGLCYSKRGTPTRSAAGAHICKLCMCLKIAE